MRTFSLWTLLVCLCAVGACAPDYRDLSTPNGRQAILDLANDYLTGGNCEGAIDTLNPLMRSQWVDNGMRLLYASAYGCKGGMNVPVQLMSLKDLVGSDIWTPLVKSNYSTGAGDGKITALEQATSIILQTANPQGSMLATALSSDANTYMVFVQLNMIGVVIGPVGAATQATGHKTISLAGRGGISDYCHVEVAFAHIKDSSQYSGSGSALTKISDSIQSICNNALAGACPGNKDLTVCMNSPALQLQGQLIMNAIDADWSF